jgi:hypothetical protein
VGPLNGVPFSPFPELSRIVPLPFALAPSDPSSNLQYATIPAWASRILANKPKVRNVRPNNSSLTALSQRVAAVFSGARWGGRNAVTRDYLQMNGNYASNLIGGQPLVRKKFWFIRLDFADARRATPNETAPRADLVCLTLRLGIV